MPSASSRLIGLGSLYTLGSAAPTLAGVLVTPVLTRALGVNQYGQVSVAIALMQILLVLFTLGLPLVITRHMYREASGEEGARALSTVGALLVLTPVAAAAGVVVMVMRISGNGSSFALPLAVIAGAAGAGIAMCQAWCVASQRAPVYVALAFAVGLVAPVVGVISVLLVSRSATAYMTSIACVLVLVDLLAALTLMPQRAWALMRSSMGRSLRIGLPLVPHQLAVSSATGASVLVAGVVAGVSGSAHTQLGIYLGTVPLIVISALAYAWTPIILGAPAADQGVVLTETTRSVVWLATFGASTVALLSPWLLRVVASSDYDVRRIIPITAVVSLSAIAAVVFMAHTQLVLASGHTGAFAFLSPLALLIGTSAGALASHWLHLTGIGLGYLCTYTLLAVFTRQLAHRRSPVRWSERVVVLPTCVATTLAVVGALAGSSGQGAVLRWGISCILVGCGVRTLLAIFRARHTAESASAPRATEADPVARRFAD